MFYSENESESLEYPDLESIQIFVESQKFLEDYKVTFDDFVKSDLMKKFKFECQKTLNITINSISHVSREQLIDKYEKLKMFLSGKSSPNILTNRGAENFSKNLLAKKIVVRKFLKLVFLCVIVNLKIYPAEKIIKFKINIFFYFIRTKVLQQYRANLNLRSRLLQLQ